MAINRNQASAPPPPGLPSNQEIAGATPWISRPPVTIVTPSPFVTIPTAPQTPQKPPTSLPPKKPTSISFWFNAFIPNDLSWIPVVTQDGGKSRYLLIAALPEMTPGAFRSFCIVNTNDRTFSADRNAARKTQIGGRIDVAKKTCVFDKASTTPTRHLSLPANISLSNILNNSAAFLADSFVLLNLFEPTKPWNEGGMRLFAQALSNSPLLVHKATSSPAYKTKPRFYTSSSGYVLECSAANRDPVARNALQPLTMIAAKSMIASSLILLRKAHRIQEANILLSQVVSRSLGNYMMPAIDMGMKLYFSKDMSRLNGYEITIDNFPAFEVYIQVDNNPPIPIFQKAPEIGTNPWNLMNASIPATSIANPMRVFKSQKVVQLWNA